MRMAQGFADAVPAQQMSPSHRSCGENAGDNKINGRR
jgi:hypothetical protein